MANISSIEVEDVLYRHPDVLTAAVVAKPDPNGVKPLRLCGIEGWIDGHT